jgi:hypothetical protein
LSHEALNKFAQLWDDPREAFFFKDRFGNKCLVTRMYGGTTQEFYRCGEINFIPDSLSGADTLTDDAGRSLFIGNHELYGLLQDFSDTARQVPLCMHIFDSEETKKLLDGSSIASGIERLRQDTGHGPLATFIVYARSLYADSIPVCIIESYDDYSWQHHYDIYKKHKSGYHFCARLESSNRDFQYDSLQNDTARHLLWMNTYGWGSGFGAQYSVGFKFVRDTLKKMTDMLPVSGGMNLMETLLPNYPSQSEWSTTVVASSPDTIVRRLKETLLAFEEDDEHGESEYVLLRDSSVLLRYTWNNDSASYVPLGNAAKLGYEMSPEVLYHKKLLRLKKYGTRRQRKYLRDYQ